METLPLNKIDFDDKDLAIAGLVLLGICVCVAGLIKDMDEAVLIGSISSIATGICGLATGRKKQQ